MLMSIRDAAAAGVTRLREPQWALAGDHIEIHVTSDGHLGPWVQFYSEMNERLGQKNPCEILITEFDADAKTWVSAPQTG